MMETKVEIDNSSGFCFGVVTAIRKAEEALDSTGSLYCLGDIVHNSDEVERLRSRFCCGHTVSPLPHTNLHGVTI